jgi:UDP-N-acetylmuramate--alanine ligase
MSGIARVLLDMGYEVSGSDLRVSSFTRRLEELGARIYVGHSRENAAGAEVVVVSTAVPPDNPETVFARESGIPVIPRAEMLGHLMKSRFGIAVAGTHGKTTTTSLIAQVMEKNGFDPTVVIGGEVNDIGSNAKLGMDGYLVAEADESDASFLSLAPRIAVVTSMDADVNLNVGRFSDHNFDLDGTRELVRAMFLEFLDKLPPDGKAILCLDNENVQMVIPRVRVPYITYGFSPEAELRAVSVRMQNFHSSCRVYRGRKFLGNLCLRIPGRHNIVNALAAVAVGMELGLEFKKISRAIDSFIGVQRRFQVLGSHEGVMVVDDYAHNPAKLKAAVAAAGTGNMKRVLAVFQPHRYSRTKFLLKEFGSAFAGADVLIVTDIYSAGEVPIEGVSGKAIVEVVQSNGKKPEVIFISPKEKIVDYLLENVREGDLVITLGAGDIHTVAENFLARFRDLQKKADI